MVRGRQKIHLCCLRFEREFSPSFSLLPDELFFPPPVLINPIWGGAFRQANLGYGPKDQRYDISIPPKILSPSCRLARVVAFDRTSIGAR
jgi:hypothetical protein